jgi:hypothetical protein
MPRHVPPISSANRAFEQPGKLLMCVKTIFSLMASGSAAIVAGIRISRSVEFILFYRTESPGGH